MPDWCRPCSPAPGQLPDGRLGRRVRLGGPRCVAYVQPGPGAAADGERTRRDRVVPGAGRAADCGARRAGGMVLDGTVVARGRGAALPRRRLLQRRTAPPARRRAICAGSPVGFIVADLLWLAGRDLVDLPYRDRRRELLEELGFARPPVVVLADLPVAEADGRDAHRRAVGRGRRCTPGTSTPRTGPGGGRGSGCGCRCAGPGRWSSAGGRRPTRSGRTGSGRCCSACPTGPDGLRYVGRVGIGAGRSAGEVGAAAGPAAPARLAVRGAAARRASPATRSGSQPRPGRAGGVHRLDAAGGCGCPRGAASVDRGRRPTRAAAAAARLTADAVAAPPGAPPAGAARRRRPRGRPPSRRRASRRRRSPPRPQPDAGARPRRRRGPPPGAALRLQRPEHHRRADAHRPRPGPRAAARVRRPEPGRGPARGQPGTLGRRARPPCAAYLQLEQARFGPRLQVEIAVDEGLHALPMAPAGCSTRCARSCSSDRAAARRGTVTVTVERAGAGCVVRVRERDGEGRGGEPLLVAPTWTKGPRRPAPLARPVGPDPVPVCPSPGRLLPPRRPCTPRRCRAYVHRRSCTLDGGRAHGRRCARRRDGVHERSGGLEPRPDARRGGVEVVEVAPRPPHHLPILCADRVFAQLLGVHDLADVLTWPQESDRT